MTAIRKMAVATYELLSPHEPGGIYQWFVVRKYEGDEHGEIICGFQEEGWARAVLNELIRRDRDIRMLLAEIDALKSEIELLRVELGNRPSPGQKPVDVWPDRW